MLDSYKTIAEGQEAQGEITDRRSRFIAQLRHIQSQRDAEAFIDQVRARHHDARHNVPAWILADGRKRCSDDGEPQRSAGLPILDVLCGSGLADVCCVVSRYFGGTLLGPGGLVRAYSSATHAAIRAAQNRGHIICMALVIPVKCVLPYAAYGRVEKMAREAGGRVRECEFAENVQMSCAFIAGTEGRFITELREITSGADSYYVGDPRYAVW